MDAVVVDVIRTPGGKRNGVLSNWHPVDLAAHVLKAIVERNSLDPVLVDDVILGCVSQVGEQSVNIARNAVLAAGFPESVPGTTVDRQCGSSQQAAAFAAQAVLSGACDVVIAGGVEAMSRIPLGSNFANGPGSPFSNDLTSRYAQRGSLFSQGISAELVADKWCLTRKELDEYSALSHERASAAQLSGAFDDEIVPVVARDANGKDTEVLITADEGIRPQTNTEILATLRPAFMENGKITAGNSSQITDGASAALIMSDERARFLGLTPRARFVSFAVCANDPVLMLTAPIPATKKVLDRARLSLAEIDRFEVNEAFSSVVLAWQREMKASLDRINTNGGAIALGHPLGASGTRLLATMINELERSGGRYGLQTMCEGGGMANAYVVERL